MSACFHLPSVVCDNCAHLRSSTARPETRTWSSNTITTSGWQIPASMLPPGDEEVERLRAEYRGEYVPPPDGFTRQQVKAMLRIALVDRTDEWLAKDVDERTEILLAMFTKEKP